MYVNEHIFFLCCFTRMAEMFVLCTIGHYQRLFINNGWASGFWLLALAYRRYLVFPCIYLFKGEKLRDLRLGGLIIGICPLSQCRSTSIVLLIISIEYLTTKQTLYYDNSHPQASRYDQKGKWHGYLSYKYKWLLVLDNLRNVTQLEAHIERLIHVSVINMQQVSASFVSIHRLIIQQSKYIPQVSHSIVKIHKLEVQQSK